jgi:hypothetical protein
MGGPNIEVWRLPRPLLYPLQYGEYDLSFTASTEPVCTTPAVTASEIRPLTSPPPTPELVGTPVEATYTPAVPATVRGIRTLCTLLHALEMYVVQSFCQLRPPV